MAKDVVISNRLIGWAVIVISCSSFFATLLYNKKIEVLAITGFVTVICVIFGSFSIFGTHKNVRPTSRLQGLIKHNNL